MATNKSRADMVKKLRAEGITREMVSGCKYFQAKEYEVAQVAVMEYCDDENGAMVITGPISIASSLAVTIQGAIEAMRENVIDCMQWYDGCEESKVFVSETINSDEEDVKYLVASVVSTKGQRHVSEFIVTTAEKLDGKYLEDIEVTL